MDKLDITIIGAGVVGLAIAANLSKKHASLLLVEKNESFGKETSSRNSEVIHSGIYYPKATLKAKLCVRGNGLMYSYLKENSIKHSRLGKLVVASNDGERQSLLKLLSNGERNGVKDLSIIEGKAVSELEPAIKSIAALNIPSTGILDTHGLMQSLLNHAKSGGVTAAFNSEVSAITALTGGGFRIKILNDGYEFETKLLINCAGHGSDKIAALCGIDIDKASYRLYHSKGDYFRTSSQFNVKKLVYPVPEAEIHSLGIHLTPDLAGGLRFGPDAEYVETLSYAVDENKKYAFAKSVQNFMPSIKAEDLFPDTSGIRPKLQGPKDNFRDFVINEESAKGLPGLINLIGIESPGLTSCLAIAEYVEQLIS
jgi:L-2-hydroxyglutarate oxidase LhgO